MVGAERMEEGSAWNQEAKVVAGPHGGGDHEGRWAIRAEATHNQV